MTALNANSIFPTVSGRNGDQAGAEDGSLSVSAELHNDLVDRAARLAPVLRAMAEDLADSKREVTRLRQDISALKRQLGIVGVESTRARLS